MHGCRVRINGRIANKPWIPRYKREEAALRDRQARAGTGRSAAAGDFRLSPDGGCIGLTAAKRSFPARGLLPRSKLNWVVQYMRNAVVLIALAIVTCGCNKQGSPPRLDGLARGLAEAWQPEAVDLKLEIHPDVDGNEVILRSVLCNLSTREIDIDQESLPWNNADAFSVSAVAANGDVIKQRAVPVSAVIAHISAPHTPVRLASGEHIEGNLDVSLLRIDGIPHNKDVLLLWSYPRLKNWASDDHYPLSGITLIEARSPAPIVAAPNPSSRAPVSGPSGLR